MEIESYFKNIDITIPKNTKMSCLAFSDEIISVFKKFIGYKIKEVGTTLLILENETQLVTIEFYEEEPLPDCVIPTLQYNISTAEKEINL